MSVAEVTMEEDPGRIEIPHVTRAGLWPGSQKGASINDSGRLGSRALPRPAALGLNVGADSRRPHCGNSELLGSRAATRHAVQQALPRHKRPASSDQTLPRKNALFYCIQVPDFVE